MDRHIKRRIDNSFVKEGVWFARDMSGVEDPSHQ